MEAIHPGLDEYFDGLRRDIPDCDILPTPFEKDELVAIVHRRVTGWSIAERRIAENLGCRSEEESTALNQPFSVGTDRERDMSEANFSTKTDLTTIKNQNGAQLLLLFAILALLAWAIFLKSSPKATGRFQPTGSPRMALDTKTGTLCSTADILSSRYNRFKDVQAAGFEGSGTFAVPESWDDKHVQSYLDTYRAEDPEGFLRPGRKEFSPVFDTSPMPLPTCSSLE